MTLLSSVPWKQVAIDVCDVAGHYGLVVIDDCSMYLEADIVHMIAAKDSIYKLDRMLAALVVKFHHGPRFNGHEFAQFP